MKLFKQQDADPQDGMAEIAGAPRTTLPTAYAHYDKAVDWDLYHSVAKQIGVPHPMPSGLVAHFAGQSGSRIDVFDLWIDFDTMDEFFALTLAESITQSIAEVTRRNDIEPEHARIETVEFGGSAPKYIGTSGDASATDFFDRDARPVGMMFGGGDRDASDYLQACRRVNTSKRLPAGLIMRLVDKTEARTVVFEAWDDALSAAHWQEIVSSENDEDGMDARRTIDLMRISLRPELFAQ